MKYRFNKEEFKLIVSKCFSIAQVCRELNIRPVGGNYKTIKRKLLKFEIDTTHFTGQGWNTGSNFRKFGKAVDLKDIITNKIVYLSGSKLRKRLILEGYKEEKCENCNRTEWMGKKIPLELNHINGNNLDNSLSNLEILCCNCHALTLNWRGRKKSKSNKSDYIDKEYNESK